ncbi:btb/poz domain-containing [Anaeramoeba flamelloides]|uniref:Btb/poz domain-containing n=1 Tax=Anaeramoeba flamelloides TaxID=1746091 RepID=A0AAV7YVV6_9EUKA|nr:btb/poz domain-containing [Anaeramoeba flamelloides]
METILDNYHQLYNNDEMCNVEFIIGKNQDMVKGHKLIFAVTSPFWKNIFFGPNWKQSETQISKVTITDIELETFQIIKKSIYLQDFTITNNFCFSILYVAKKFQLMGLQTQCINYIKDQLSCKNCFRYLQKCLQLFDHHQLCQHILQFITNNYPKIIQSVCCFNDVHEDILIILLNSKLTKSDPTLINRFLERGIYICQKHCTEVNFVNILNSNKKIFDSYIGLFPNFLGFIHDHFQKHFLLNNNLVHCIEQFSQKNSEEGEELKGTKQKKTIKKSKKKRKTKAIKIKKIIQLIKKDKEKSNHNQFIIENGKENQYEKEKEIEKENWKEKEKEIEKEKKEKEKKGEKEQLYVVKCQKNNGGLLENGSNYKICNNQRNSLMEYTKLIPSATKCPSVFDKMQLFELEKDLNRLNLPVRERKTLTTNKQEDRKKILLMTTDDNKLHHVDIIKSIKFESNVEVSILNVSNDNPSFLSLRQYDSIFLYCSIDVFQDPVEIGNTLANYVEDGGGLVVCSYRSLILNSSKYKKAELKGRIVDQNFLPITKGVLQKEVRGYLGKIFDHNHPLVLNVKDFNGGSLSYRINCQLNSNGEASQLQEIAKWNDGNPLIAFKRLKPHYGTVVVLNIWPVSGEVGQKNKARYAFWLPSTDGNRIISNSIKFTSGI